MVDEVVVPSVHTVVDVLAPSVAVVKEVEKVLGEKVVEDDDADADCLLTAVLLVTVSYVIGPRGGGIIVSL